MKLMGILAAVLLAAYALGVRIHPETFSSGQMSAWVTVHPKDNLWAKRFMVKSMNLNPDRRSLL